MRKIILNLAISLDGYICDPHGGFDWIVGQGDTSQDTENKFDFDQFLDQVDTIVMGSLAYEDCVLSGLSPFDDHKKVVATTRNLEAYPKTSFIKGNITESIMALKNREGKDIWLFGGAGLTEPFIKEDLVDQYIIGIIPILLGDGRKLFKGTYKSISLHLDEISVNDGITILIYSRK